MKRDRVYNQLALLGLALTIIVGLYDLIILIGPQLPINPFPPVRVLTAAELGPTPTGEPTLPPTWTSTPLPTATEPRPTATPTIAPTKRPTWTPTIPPAPTLNPLLPTRSPFKFTASDPVFMADKYGAACGNWGGVGGQVFDIDGSPLSGVSVVGWGGPVPEQDKRVFTSGSANRIDKFYGAGGYELYIGAPGDFEFNVAVYENGQPVSPILKLKMVNDCTRDLVLINFQRNH
jgi:hypothetical protein